ncbi:hypothetical protein JW949_04360 [Candidatus Woesearchaeota archaeon]|nr:hypothetical protein [Candidatus Woesearchaeota archaeon]
MGKEKRLVKYIVSVKTKEESLPSKLTECITTLFGSLYIVYDKYDEQNNDFSKLYMMPKPTDKPLTDEEIEIIKNSIVEENLDMSFYELNEINGLIKGVKEISEMMDGGKNTILSYFK